MSIEKKEEQFGPGFLYGEHLLVDGQWREVTLTIETVEKPNTVKSADGKAIPFPVLTFKGTDKRLVLKPVNQRLLKSALGTDKVAEWIGKPVTVHAAKGTWFGQADVAAVRVRVPKGLARPWIRPAVSGVDLTGTKVE